MSADFKRVQGNNSSLVAKCLVIAYLKRRVSHGVHPSFCALSPTHFVFTADHLTIFIQQQHVREALFPKLLPLLSPA